MSRRHRRSLFPVVRGPHWHGLGPHEPAAALRPSRCYFQPCPHHRLRPGRRPTTRATFASSRFSRHRHSLSALLPRSPPCRSATPLTHTPFPHPFHYYCLVQVKIASGAGLLLEFAIYVWT